MAERPVLKDTVNPETPAQKWQALTGRLKQVALIALACLLLLVGIVPQSLIPASWTPFTDDEGVFAGEVVRLATPKSREPDVALNVRLKMQRGACRVYLDHEGKSGLLFSMGEGAYRTRVPSGSGLVLDPQENSGEYEIMLGPPWHPLATKGRRVILLPMGLGVLGSLLFAGRVCSLAARLGTKRTLFLVGIGVVSGLVLYPAVHEAGHMLFGLWFGATPNWAGAVWTSLGGEEPHAAFRDLPRAAAPFMSAGGPLLPMMVAFLLLGAWRIVRHKTSWYVSAGLVTIAVLFLLSNAGGLFELSGKTHMNALALHLGLNGPARVAFCLSPLALTLAVYGWLWRQLAHHRPVAQS